MPYPTIRMIFVAVFLAACALMAFGFYLQFALQLEPCPLCITQRFFIVLFGCTALLAAIHHPRSLGTRIYGALIVLFAVTGASFSARQVYLQSLPPEAAPACGPSLEYLLETFPLTEALSLLLRGDGSCAEVVWTFLGLSIPAWTLIAFLIIAAIGSLITANLIER